MLVAALPLLFAVEGVQCPKLPPESQHLAHLGLVGLLIAVVAAFEPMVFITALAGFGRSFGTIGVVTASNYCRGVAVVSLSVAIAALMHSLGWTSSGSEQVPSHLLVRSPWEDPDGLADVLRFALEFYGSGYMSPLLVAAVPLLLGRGERLRMALTGGLLPLSDFSVVFTK